jgi:hypothetical protein
MHTSACIPRRFALANNSLQVLLFMSHASAVRSRGVATSCTGTLELTEYFVHQLSGLPVQKLSSATLTLHDSIHQPLCTILSTSNLLHVNT